MRGLKGKIAAVTGSGIGQAGAQATVDHIEAAGGEAIAIETDFSNEASVEAAFAEIVRQFGRLDILVSHAGIFSGECDDKVDMGNGLPVISFEEAQKLAADPEATAAYYKKWTESLTADLLGKTPPAIAAESE